MSSSESESDESTNHDQTKRVGNAFAGLSFDSDSDSSSDDEKSVDDTKKAPIAPNELSPTNDKLGEDESCTSSSESEEDGAKGEISDFDDLIGSSTRHGTATTLQADFVNAIKELVGGREQGKDKPKPTQIQSECWTTMLTSLTSDRDVIAISKTGSGKTLAFLVPLLASLQIGGGESRQSSKSEFVHPRAIVLAPTRVLAQQIFEVASALVQNTPSLASKGVTAAVVLGGAAYHQQMSDLLTQDPDVIIATPGRLNSLCGHVATKTATTSQDGESEPAMCIKLDKVTELVIDEADMMLSLGFQKDLNWFAQLVNHASIEGFRVVLTSATWGTATSANLSRFESISSAEQHDPVILATTDEAGTAGQMVTKNVTQLVEVLAHKGAPRFNHLVQLLVAALKLGKKDFESSRVVVFCLHKSQARQVGKDLKAKGIANVVLEGDMSQSARAAAIETFRHGKEGRRILVATDVAARGLDILTISHVFNYSLGISIESYIHRCGRTGRAGRFGVAHTFVVKGVDENLSPDLVGVLHQANQKIPDDLRIMASKVLKKRRQGPGAIKSKEEIEDAEELREVREANREKQRLMNQNHQRGSKKNQNAKRGGRGRK